MKNLVLATLALLLCGSLSACVNSGPSGSTQTQSRGGAFVPPTTTISTAQTRIGLLLPLTGQYAEVGQGLQNAAQLAFYDNAPSTTELIIRDSGDTASQAQNAAEDEISQGAQVLIGPLTGPQVEAVQSTTRSTQTPILAFSTDTRLAGGGTYLLGFLPQGQVKRVLAYAVSQGKTQVAVLAPDDAYGQLIEAAARNTRVPGLSLRTARYTKGDTASIQYAINQLTKTNKPQAILLAEAPGASLNTVINALSAAQMGPTHMQYLGTGLWDDTQIAQDSNLQGAWYAAADPNARTRFQNRYQQQFGAPPQRLASLGYDGMALVAVNLKQNGNTRFNPNTLSNPTGFAGVDGVFRLNADGTNERALAILEVTRNTPRLRQGAPSQFGPLS